MHSRAPLWDQAEARTSAKVALLLGFHSFPFLFPLLPSTRALSWEHFLPLRLHMISDESLLLRNQTQHRGHADLHLTQDTPDVVQILEQES